MNTRCIHNNQRKFLLLAIFFGLLVTVITYSGFGIRDHIEQLPVIFRRLDSAYLPQDFFTNAASEAIARRNYATLISVVGRKEANLPLLFLLLTGIANIGMSVVTYWLAKMLSHGSQLAGIMASAMVMSLSLFDLAWEGTRIYATMLTPSTLSLPLLMLGIYLAIKKNLVLSLLVCGLASLIHPLFALEVGGLILLSFAIISWRNCQKEQNPWHKKVWISVGILLFFAMLSIIPQYTQDAIDPAAFIHIIATVRHPHHYLPSTFAWADYQMAIAFLIALMLVWVQKHTQYEQFSNDFLVTCVALILVLCLGGYVFVEILPMRLWVTGQFFRLLTLVKWIGIIFIAAHIASQATRSSRLMLYFVSVFNPFLLCFTVGTLTLKDVSMKKGSRLHQFIHPAVIVMIVLLTIVLMPEIIDPQAVLLLTMYSLLAALVIFSTTKPLLPVGVAMGVVVLVIVWFSSMEDTSSQPLLISMLHNPKLLTIDIAPDLGTQAQPVVDYARQDTPADSIFLTPPDWGQFRLLARRAIVVDFKAFPFTDAGMDEWHDRMIACYGTPKQNGFSMLWELRRNYRSITDESINELSANYGINYVVLYRETETSHAVVYEDDYYKIISLSATTAP